MYIHSVKFYRRVGCYYPGSAASGGWSTYNQKTSFGLCATPWPQVTGGQGFFSVQTLWFQGILTAAGQGKSFSSSAAVEVLAAVLRKRQGVVDRFFIDHQRACWYNVYRE